MLRGIAAPVRGRVQYNNIDCLYQATLAGQGLSILPVYLCAPALADGRARVTLDSVYPLAAVADAHRYVEDNRNLGKVVLSLLPVIVP